MIIVIPENAYYFVIFTKMKLVNFQESFHIMKSLKISVVRLSVVELHSMVFVIVVVKKFLKLKERKNEII